MCTVSPTQNPSVPPTQSPTSAPSDFPSNDPSSHPSNAPSTAPSTNPSLAPTSRPSESPLSPGDPTKAPSLATRSPSKPPTYDPTSSPTDNPSTAPTDSPSSAPSVSPSHSPSVAPTYAPSSAPSHNPSYIPSIAPTYPPSSAPTANPTSITSLPSSDPTTAKPTTDKPTTDEPTTAKPTTMKPTKSPTSNPSVSPTIAGCVLAVVTAPVQLTWPVNRDNSDVIQLQNDVSLNATKLEISILKDIMDKIHADHGSDEESECEQRDIRVNITVQSVSDHQFIITLQIMLNGEYSDSLLLFFKDEQFNEEVKEDIQEIYDVEVEDTVVTVIKIDVVYIKPEYDQSHSDWDRNISKTFNIISISLITMFGIVALIGFIDAQWIRKNDVFQVAALMIFVVYTLDFVSDVLFAAQVIVLAGSTLEYIIFICCCIFVVLPLSLNLMQLRSEISVWLQDPYNSTEIEAYLMNKGKMLGILTVVTGNSFAVIQLCESALFSLDVFWIGLRKEQVMKFKNKRLYSVVLLENIPQMILQLMYGLMVEKSVHGFTLLVFMCSTLSVIVSLFEFSTQSQILRNRSPLIMDISFEVKSKEIQKRARRLQFIQKEVTEYVVNVLYLNVERRAIEQLRSKQSHDGLMLRFRVNVTKSTDNKTDSNDIEVIIQKKIDDGGLVETVKMAWQQQRKEETQERMEETQRLLRKEHDMRVKEHKQLQNAFKGFLTAFGHIYDQQGDAQGNVNDQ
eukprot:162589_1